MEKDFFRKRHHLSIRVSDVSIACVREEAKKKNISITQAVENLILQGHLARNLASTLPGKAEQEKER